jgi:hypothetical protein
VGFFIWKFAPRTAKKLFEAQGKEARSGFVDRAGLFLSNATSGVVTQEKFI